MDRPVELIPLVCPKCSTPVPAGVDEVAWVCATCKQGLVLDDETGLGLLDVLFSAQIPPNQEGRPFWMAEGRVALQRQSFDSRGAAGQEAEQFWSVPHRFFAPAFACSLEELLKPGLDFLLNPPELKPGSPVRFQPVVLSPIDFPAAVEFIVVALEAGRKDRVREIKFSLELATPSLWIFP